MVAERLGFQAKFIQGSDGVINYLRMKHIVTGKKLYIPVIVRKQLSRMFKRKRDAELYAKIVLTRYQRLLKCKEDNTNDL